MACTAIPAIRIMEFILTGTECFTLNNSSYRGWMLGLDTDISKNGLNMCRKFSNKFLKYLAVIVLDIIILTHKEHTF